MKTLCQTANRHCQPCEGGVAVLNDEQVHALLAGLEGWQLAEGVLDRTYRFKNHYETMAFVNALAWISHRQDHHPEITVGYGECRIRYWTHAIGGLSENDFICAAKVEQLFSL